MWSYIQNVGATDAVAPIASETWTANFKNPDVPLNVPARDSWLRDVPAGSGPCVRLYAYGPAPPLWVPKAPHTSAQPNSTLQYWAQDGIRVTASAGAMPIVPGMLALLSPLSATWIVTAKVPAAPGVPATDPSPARVRPSGSEPSLTLHL